MTEKNLRSMGKTDLLHLLNELEKEKEQLVEENQQLKTQLEERKVFFEEAGSLAEASLKITNIFNVCQESADIYLQNIKVLEDETRAKADEIEREAREKADSMISEAEKKCLEAKEKEEKHMEEVWQEFENRLLEFGKVHSDISQLVSKAKIFPMPTQEKVDD